MKKSTLITILCAEIGSLLTVSVPIAFLGVASSLSSMAGEVPEPANSSVGGFSIACMSFPMMLVLGILLAAYFLWKNDLRRAKFALSLPAPSGVAIALYFVSGVGTVFIHSICG